MMCIIVHIYMYITLMDMKVFIQMYIILSLPISIGPLMFRLLKSARIGISKGLIYIYSFFKDKNNISKQVSITYNYLNI